MRNLMWKGELEGKIKLDTISNREGLYALGPLEGLRGEILVKNGECFVSRVTSNSTMSVEKSFEVEAPFLVYTNVKEWDEIALPDSIKTIKQLEVFIDSKTKSAKRPFAFRLEGSINSATIHIQNLAPGSEVSSPEEAHSGQVKYNLAQDEVEIVGFFSTKHQGVFTHHDTFLHLHIITADEKKMGHLDKVEMEEMKLFLPKR